MNKSICDHFFEAQSKATTPDDVPPVISTPHYYLIPVYRNEMYMVAVIQNEGVLVQQNVLFSCMFFSGLVPMRSFFSSHFLCSTGKHACKDHSSHIVVFLRTGSLLQRGALAELAQS